MYYRMYYRKNKCWLHFTLAGSLKCKAMIGPHWMGVVMTIGVIMGGTMMNLRIIRHSQPISSVNLLALHVFIGVFCSMSILLLLLTATTDPGIVYPNLDDYESQFLCNLPGIEMFVYVWKHRC